MQDTSTAPVKQRPWYREEWLLVLMVILPPIGIVRMWSAVAWRNKTKLWTTVGLLLLTLTYGAAALYGYNQGRPYAADDQIVHTQDKIIQRSDKTTIRINATTGEAVYVPIPAAEVNAAQAFLSRKYGQPFHVVDRINHYSSQGPKGTVAWYKMNASTEVNGESLWSGIELSTASNRSKRPYDENFLDLYWGKQEEPATRDFLLSLYPTAPMHRVEIRPSDALYAQINGSVPSLEQVKRTNSKDIGYKIYVDQYYLQQKEDMTDAQYAEHDAKIYKIAQYALAKYPTTPTIDYVIHINGGLKKFYYQCIVDKTKAAQLQSDADLKTCFIRHDGNVDRY